MNKLDTLADDKIDLNEYADEIIFKLKSDKFIDIASFSNFSEFRKSLIETLKHLTYEVGTKTLKAYIDSPEEYTDYE